MYVCMYVCIYIYVCMYISIYLSIFFFFIYIYMHTYMFYYIDLGYTLRRELLRRQGRGRTEESLPRQVLNSLALLALLVQSYRYWHRLGASATAFKNTRIHAAIITQFTCFTSTNVRILTQRGDYGGSAAFKSTPIHAAVKTAIETVRVTFNTLDASGRALNSALVAP
jgi:hypothetical protein